MRTADPKTTTNTHTKKKTQLKHNTKDVIKPQEKRPNKERKKKVLQKQAKTIKKMPIGTYILIITLTVNGLNAQTKRHRQAEGVQKQDPYICCLQETNFRPRDTYRLKVR